MIQRDTEQSSSLKSQASAESASLVAGHTPGPWVGFTDEGATTAIMPAMRDGEICTFMQSPTDADAYLMVAAPDMLDALEEARLQIEYLEAKFCPTGSGANVLAKIERAIAAAKGAA